jgi:hypothetical protein
MRPIFVFSLPRSGSTLLQRVLSREPGIETVPEPWILLPLFSCLRDDGIYTDYGHSLYRRAAKDLENELDDGRAAVDDALRQCVLRLYQHASDDNPAMFLDKTPRYHLIAEHILRIFPDARFIFLWRNPLSLIASMLTTWGEGRWILYRYKVDLYRGLSRLVNAYQTTTRNVLSVQFEDLVRFENQGWERIYDYLDLDADGVDASMHVPEIGGEMGDPKQGAYEGISKDPVAKWKRVITNPLRKAWVKRYLRWVRRDRLATMGYDLDALLDEIDDVPLSPDYLLSDLGRMGMGIIHPFLDHYVWKGKTTKRWGEAVAHH